MNGNGSDQWKNALQKARGKFELINGSNIVNYDTEAMFIMQSLQKNDFLMKTANKNPTSLRNAMINVAAIGLSLNPATQYAYIVPRDGSCVLDISYKGLIKIATDTGSILWAKADMVYSNDKFDYLGPATLPIHEADVFSNNRGDFRGVYCVAKTSSGDYLIETMSSGEILQVRDKSMAFTKGKSGPWVEWFSEMAKKTIIKRASKTWPKSNKNQRLDEAINVINVHEGIEFEAHESLKEALEEHQDTIKTVVDGIEGGDWEEAADAWCALTHEQQQSIWVAPTKAARAGIKPPFTTEQRTIIKSKEFTDFHYNKHMLEHNVIDSDPEQPNTT